MSKVDWSLAPEGAQIYSPACGELKACWYKKEGDKIYCWIDGDSSWSTREYMIGELIYRPKQEPKPWSGPEDGLPPVNTVCEVVEGPAYWDSQESEWLGSNVKVKAVFVNDIGQSIVAVERFDGRCSCFIIECLAVTKTSEQIEADKRETAIREIMDIAQVDCRVTAARLVDAGFKREVV